MPKFIPEKNKYITISLTGELLRALVLEVVNINTIIVEIVTEPLGKSHNYKYKDVVVCKRTLSMFGEEWEVKPKDIMPLQEMVKQEKEEEKKTKTKSNLKKVMKKIVIPLKKKAKKHG